MLVLVLVVYCWLTELFLVIWVFIVFVVNGWLCSQWCAVLSVVLV